MKPRLLLAESSEFSAEALRTLQGAFEVTCADLTRDELLQRIGPFEFVWVRLRHRIDREVFAAARALKVLATNTTGLNHIDLAAAQERRVDVVSLRGEVDFLRTIRATAELTIALTLAVLRRLPAAHEHVFRGGWDRNLFRGREIYEKVVGLVGFGRLGRIAASLFRAFGAEVIANDPRWGVGTIEEGVTMVSLDELCSRANIVSLHANYSPENAGFFGRDQFARMQPGTILINTARGELVDEMALLDAAREGILGGIGLDVIADEHGERGIVRQLATVCNERIPLVMTPHLGGCTVESTERTEMFLARKLVALASAGAASSATT